VDNAGWRKATIGIIFILIPVLVFGGVFYLRILRAQSEEPETVSFTDTVKIALGQPTTTPTDVPGGAQLTDVTPTSKSSDTTKPRYSAQPVYQTNPSTSSNNNTAATPTPSRSNTTAPTISPVSTQPSATSVRTSATPVATQRQNTPTATPSSISSGSAAITYERILPVFAPITTTELGKSATLQGVSFAYPTTWKLSTISPGVYRLERDAAMYLVLNFNIVQSTITPVTCPTSRFQTASGETVAKVTKALEGTSVIRYQNFVPSSTCGQLKYLSSRDVPAVDVYGTVNGEATFDSILKTFRL
jgi:hypothetical protein